MTLEENKEIDNKSKDKEIKEKSEKDEGPQGINEQLGNESDAKPDLKKEINNDIISIDKKEPSLSNIDNKSGLNKEISIINKIDTPNNKNNNLDFFKEDKISFVNKEQEIKKVDDINKIDENTNNDINNIKMKNEEKKDKKEDNDENNQILNNNISEEIIEEIKNKTSIEEQNDNNIINNSNNKYGENLNEKNESVLDPDQQNDLSKDKELKEKNEKPIESKDNNNDKKNEDKDNKSLNELNQKENIKKEEEIDKNILEDKSLDKITAENNSALKNNIIIKGKIDNPNEGNNIKNINEYKQDLKNELSVKKLDDKIISEMKKEEIKEINDKDTKIENNVLNIKENIESEDFVQNDTNNNNIETSKENMYEQKIILEENKESVIKNNSKEDKEKSENVDESNNLHQPLEKDNPKEEKKEDKNEEESNIKEQNVKNESLSTSNNIKLEINNSHQNIDVNLNIENDKKEKEHFNDYKEETQKEPENPNIIIDNKNNNMNDVKTEIEKDFDNKIIDKKNFIQKEGETQSTNLVSNKEKEDKEITLSSKDKKENVSLFPLSTEDQTNEAFSFSNSLTKDKTKSKEENDKNSNDENKQLSLNKKKSEGKTKSKEKVSPFDTFFQNNKEENKEKVFNTPLFSSENNNGLSSNNKSNNLFGNKIFEEKEEEKNIFGNIFTNNCTNQDTKQSLFDFIKENNKKEEQGNFELNNIFGNNKENSLNKESSLFPNKTTEIISGNTLFGQKTDENKLVKDEQKNKDKTLFFDSKGDDLNIEKNKSVKAKPNKDMPLFGNNNTGQSLFDNNKKNQSLFFPNEESENPQKGQVFTSSLFTNKENINSNENQNKSPLLENNNHENQEMTSLFENMNIKEKPDINNKKSSIFDNNAIAPNILINSKQSEENNNKSSLFQNGSLYDPFGIIKNDKDKNMHDNKESLFAEKNSLFNIENIFDSQNNKFYNKNQGINNKKNKNKVFAHQNDNNTSDNILFKYLKNKKTNNQIKKGEKETINPRTEEINEEEEEEEEIKQIKKSKNKKTIKNINNKSDNYLNKDDSDSVISEEDEEQIYYKGNSNYILNNIYNGSNKSEKQISKRKPISRKIYTNLLKKMIHLTEKNINMIDKEPINSDNKYNDIIDNYINYLENDLSNMKNGYIYALVKKHYYKNEHLKKRILIQANIPQKRNNVKKCYNELTTLINNKLENDEENQIYYFNIILEMLKKYENISDNDLLIAKKMYKENKLETLKKDKILIKDIKNEDEDNNIENGWIKQRKTSKMNPMKLIIVVLPLAFASFYIYNLFKS